MKKILAVLGWMLVIFLLSSQTAMTSNTESKATVGMILKAVGQIYEGGSDEIGHGRLEEYNLILRKSSHALAYFILAMIVMAIPGWKRTRGYKAVLVSFFICAFFAISDEIHQRFVPGRTSSATDVLIDCSGAIVGIVLYLIIIRRVRSRSSENYPQ